MSENELDSLMRQADMARKDAVEESMDWSGEGKVGHTPGPWTSAHGRWVKANKGTIATCHNQWNVTDELLSDQEVGANARLMAAAPELLRALERTLSFALGWADEARESAPGGGEDWPWVIEAREAINKATKEEA